MHSAEALRPLACAAVTALLVIPLPARAASLSDWPMSYLWSAGSKADRVLPLTWGLLIISIVVTVIVTILLLQGLLRARPPLPADAVPPVEHPPGGLSWLYVGVGISTVVLIASAVWTLFTLAAVGQTPAKPSLFIEVTGHQWWWEVHYLSDQPSHTFTTANEIHIPVGANVAVKLKTADVIHSFWVPTLTGKMDLVPGQTNETWLEANEPGTYRGQCTEYCGEQHAHMALNVIADEPNNFEAWRDEQLASSAAPEQGSALTGAMLFVGRCGICHTVRGTSAGGKLGPDLSHLMQRKTIAAGTLPNKPGYLAGWISDPQHIKPGSFMPRPELSAGDLQQILAYLETLK